MIRIEQVATGEAVTLAECGDDDAQRMILESALDYDGAAVVVAGYRVAVVEGCGRDAAIEYGRVMSRIERRRARPDDGGEISLYIRGLPPRLDDDAHRALGARLAAAAAYYEAAAVMLAELGDDCDAATASRVRVEADSLDSIGARIMGYR